MSRQTPSLPKKVLRAVFYREPTSNPPSEPVRDWLLSQGTEAMKVIGGDIMIVECYWPNVQAARPKLIKHLRDDLWEIKCNLHNLTARILFTVSGGQMVLLHAFMKKTAKTPNPDLNLALRRLKLWKSTESKK
jgi:phage-related protein